MRDSPYRAEELKEDNRVLEDGGGLQQDEPVVVCGERAQPALHLGSEGQVAGSKQRVASSK